MEFDELHALIPITLGLPADAFDKLLAKYAHQTDKRIQRLRGHIKKLEDISIEEQRKKEDFDAMRHQLEQIKYAQSAK